MRRLSKDKEEVKSFLAEETLFGGAGPKALERLSEITVERSVPGGCTLFSMGQVCDALHIVVEGSAILVVMAPDGRERILHRVVAGEMVGAVPFFDGKCYPASFVAETDTVVIAFPRQDLLRVLGDEPGLALSILGGIADRLRMMVTLVEQHSFDDTQRRLWAYLVAGSRGTGHAEFPREIVSMPTREHIAHSIGTVREVVSRRLSRLVDSGHVRIDGRRLVLVKPLL
ncbi:MAG: Crp/Fnr family transcriptional regulator [Planctomycetes bacterium]|nr:Crp/Fnr family transcriptional regulator [Planctomycetota bacterium]